MTNAEAIEILRKFKPCEQGFCNGGIELLNNLGGLAMELAIESLKKQIPKEPVGDLHSCPHYRCPVCREGVKMYEDSLTFPFCHHCGQALRWR